jgi:uncharacterized membrane protein YkvA (DUF1232 family)
MAEIDERCLEAFPRWLSQLADDVRSVLLLLGRSDLPAPVRTRAAGMLNYLLKSIDLIPDGIEDLGFMDDAFVLRVGARRAVADIDDSAPPDVLARLAGEAELVEELLGPTYAALDRYVAELEALSVRGRTATNISDDESLRNEFASEVRSWAEGYTPPAFARDTKNLVKLKSFLATKLGQ